MMYPIKLCIFCKHFDLWTGDADGGWVECQKDRFTTLECQDERQLRKLITLAKQCEHYREVME